MLFEFSGTGKEQAVNRLEEYDHTTGKVIGYFCLNKADVRLRRDAFDAYILGRAVDL